MSVDEFIEATTSADSPTELLSQFRRAVAGMGYDNIVYAEVCGSDILELPILICPEGYGDYYFESGYDEIDPVPPLAMTAATPYAWNDIGKIVDLSRKQRHFFDDCNSGGVADGVTIPIHRRCGKTTVISLSCRERNPDGAAFLPKLNAMAVQFDFARSRLLEPDTGLRQPVVLSPRERECLRWCKTGKSAWDISQILDISERTAQFHISNAMSKLGASTRIAAVVIAIQQGLLSL